MNTLPDKFRCLRLPTISRQLDLVLTQATAKNLSMSQALEWLCDLELESRHQHTVEHRFRLSRLHEQLTIEQFNWQHHISRQRIKQTVLELLGMHFIAQGANIVLVGNPGRGKTFLAKIFGWKACQANSKVLFTTAMDMLNQLNAAQLDHSLARRLKSYTDPHLIVIDELGYIPLDLASSNLFFQVISTRHSRSRSSIITTNASFSEWGNLFYNNTIAAAIVDRLVERSHNFLLGGDSLRDPKKDRPHR